MPKGIALLDESGGYPRLHYVFDVSDTAPRRNALYPDLWEVEQTAENRMQQLMNDLLERNPAPDEKKNRMAWVQLGKTADSCGVPLHNPTIRFREEALPVGAAAYASGADVWLEAHAKE